MKIVFFGNGVRGVKCLEALVEAKENVVAVVGHPGEKTEFIRYAVDLGIEIYNPNNVNGAEFYCKMTELKADLFILSGYNQILKPDIINLPSNACINLHGGLLPDYRGCAPINWQIINGENRGGCCILFVDKGIDTGNIITQSYYDISEKENSLDIVNKQLCLFPEMLVKVLKDFKRGCVEGVPQNKNEGCYYTRRYPRDSIIKWETMTAIQVYNLVRALVDPYPNAFTYYRNKKLLIRKANKIIPPIKGIPGRLSLKRQEGIIISCKDESLLITEVAFDEDKIPFNPASIFKIGTDFVS